MPDKITITVCRDGIPSGIVLIEDVAALSKSLYDSIVRMVQNDLGYPCRHRPREETKQLVKIGLNSIHEGSGVLQFLSLPIEGYEGRQPATIAAYEILTGFEFYQEVGTWPEFLPEIVRTQLGAALEPITGGTASVRLSVTENGTPKDCRIDNSMSLALQSTPKYVSEEQVEVVGRIFDLNIDKKIIKIDTSPQKVIVYADDDTFNEADKYRWQKIYLTGYPMDTKCKRIQDIGGLRLASDEEEDGISKECKIPKVETRADYLEIKNRIDLFYDYEEKWDTYEAEAPQKPLLKFSLEFIKDAILVLQRHQISLPNTFVVPTKDGGVQFEWEHEDRVLELEIIDKNMFKYLSIEKDTEKESVASRWQALRLMRWVATGERI